MLWVRDNDLIRPQNIAGNAVSSYNISNDIVSKVMLYFIYIVVHVYIPAVHPIMIQGFKMYSTKYNNSIYMKI